MEELQVKPRYIKSRKPWGLPIPGAKGADIDLDYVAMMPYTQADMIREYFPSSHKINDPVYYPDIFIKSKTKLSNGKTGVKFFKQPVPRCSYAFQQIIATKRCLHLVGNDIQFEHIDDRDDQHSETYRLFRTGWGQKDMDCLFGKAVLSSLIVADTAIVFWMEGSKMKTRVLSYFDGDTLYPHYKRDGKTLSMFARYFKTKDEDGDDMMEYLEVWTESEYYVFRMKSAKYKSALEKVVAPILQLFDLNSYDLIEKQHHGLGRVPVAYFRREDGPAWVYSQDTIENYELAKSQMAQNNREYGEPALVVCSEDEVGINVARDAKGTVREYHVGKDDKVEMLQGQSAADGFIKQTEADEKLIYKQSFIVDTPEMKSGDLPAAALKIMYSLAYEMAYKESLLYQDFLRDVVELFAKCYGIEMEKSLDFAELLENIRFWIQPYVHQNDSAIVADIVSLKNSKLISTATACERLEGIYTCPGEADAILKEANTADAHDLLMQVKLMKQEANVSNATQEQKPEE